MMMKRIFMRKCLAATTAFAVVISAAVSVAIPSAQAATGVKSAVTAKVTAPSAAKPAATVKMTQVVKAPLVFLFDGLHIAPQAGEEGFLYKNTTYVPLRFMANALEKDVRWEQSTSTVYVSEPTKDQLIRIRELNMNSVVRDDAAGAAVVAKAQFKSLPLVAKPINYVFDGEKKSPAAGQTGFIYNNKTYVPLRFFSQSVGRDIGWDQKTFSISVNQSGHVASDADAGGTDAGAGEQGDAGAGGAGVPIIPGGGSGGAAPAYNSLIAKAEQDLTALKTQCRADLAPLAEQFLAANTLDEQLTIYSQGQAKLSACDAKFESIMNKLSTDLTNNKYDTSVIEQYRTDYQAMKDAEIQKIMDKMK